MAVTRSRGVASEAFELDQSGRSPVKQSARSTATTRSKSPSKRGKKILEPQAAATFSKAPTESKKEPLSRKLALTHWNGEYEFGGPIGNIAMMVGFPALMYYLFVCYRYNGSQLMFPVPHETYWNFVKRVAGLAYKGAYPTKEAWAIEGGYFVFQLILAAYLPGGLWTEGVEVAHLGKHLPYYCNAFQSLYFSIFVALVFHFTGIFKLYTILERFGEIMSVSIIIGFVFSFYIYIQSLAEGTAIRMSGSHIYDFFMGAPLYPRLGKVDYKLFFEVRLPWFTLLFLSLALCLYQYDTYGTVSGQALVGLLGTWLYGNACAKGEHLIVPSWDMFYEKFGFMLIFWNISGVPFTYCYNTLYMYSHDPREYSMASWKVVSIGILLLCAHIVFDLGNGQKNSFRLNMENKLIKRYAFPVWPGTVLENPEYITTKTGSKLLTGGVFKYARKAHYTGDMIQNLCWALITGFNSPLPYFYPVFFFFMILHRTKRDFEKCAEKYGEDWEEYKRLCPYVYIPYVF